MTSNLPKVLVACPTYSGMSYCLDRFIERIKDLSYANYDVLIIDNSEGEEYFNKLSLVDGVKVLRDKPIEKNPRKTNLKNSKTSKGFRNNNDRN